MKNRQKWGGNPIQYEQFVKNMKFFILVLAKKKEICYTF